MADIDVFQTVTSVSFEVEPNTNVININKITTSGYTGVPNLQDVTDIGASTTNPITANSFIKSGGTGANVLLDNGNTAILPSTVGLATTNYVDNKDNSKQLQLNYLDRDNSIFDAFYLRTIADGATVEASNQLLSSLAVLRNISYVNQGYTQQINADKFVKLGGTSDEFLMADGSVSFGGGGGGATNLAYTPSPTNGIVTSNTGTDATIPLADVTNAGLLTPAEKTKIANSVPYTGATSDVNLGEFGITTGQITLDTTPTGTATVGTTQWNDTLGSSQTTLKGGNVILKNGVDLIARIVNKVTPNQTLTKNEYQVVRVIGATGQRLSVELAQGNSDLNSADTIGIVIETIATNQEGFIITMGQIEDINTTGSLQGETWADGDVLYLSPYIAGRLTNIQPNASIGHIVVIGYVEYAHINQGKIYVKIMNGWELDELHNVYINNELNNEGLFYETSTQLWKNKSIATVLGYTPANDSNVVRNTGDQIIGGVKSFTSNPIIPANGGNTGAASLVMDNGAGQLSVAYLGVFPNSSELSYVKGVTSAIQTQFTGKQANLVSGTNIKTINGNSILGSGNLTVSQTGTIIVTSGTSFTTPPNITTSTVFIIELVGAGGGGGGGATGTSAGGSGGGGGGYVYKQITGLTPSTTYTCAIGVGGTGGGNTLNGTSGTSTTLSIGAITYTATGGLFGIGVVSSAGGAGGIGSNGDINISGQFGGDSLAAAASVPSALGGNSPKGWGLGGAGVGTPSNGESATGYGGGGSAGKGTTGAPTGGNGANGIIYCQYFN